MCPLFKNKTQKNPQNEKIVLKNCSEKKILYEARVKTKQK